MVLPEPVLSDDDNKVATEAFSNPSNLIPNTWSKDPTKSAVLRAMASCLARLDDISRHHFEMNGVCVLAQKWVCFLHSYSLKVEEVRY